MTGFSKNARLVLEKRYLKKDENGEVVETPDAMFTRVAKAVAAADRIFDPKADVDKSRRSFFDIMKKLWFLPNSPTLMNAGRRLGQLAACFVLPLEDSMESIFETLKHTAIIHKSGGGTGFSFSRIRPAADKVLSTAGVSSGPMSFMNVFDVATETVKQGGTRRGANMGILRVDHPDIERFIASKTDLKRLNNFNISVAVTDRFMEALAKDADYGLVNPRTNETVRYVSAKTIFEMMVFSAWKTGEPGIIFIDRINANQPTPHLGPIESTNPCGEQPLLPYESCTLGSINLAGMAIGSKINFNRLGQTVHAAVHFLDNVLEVNRYPLPQIEKLSKKTRKIGLGVMGFADMLLKMGVGYDTEEAAHQAETLMSFILTEARKASARLAEKRGNFPAYKGSVFDTPQTPYMRNATTTTIAPTGTISLIAQTSSGIEPVFALAHRRAALDGRLSPEVHPIFLAAAKKAGIYNKAFAEKLVETGSIQKFENIGPEMKRLFVTSHDIAPKWHVSIQAAFQKYTDNAVSKTVNFPAEATRKEVEEVFRTAFETGCKGVTIYRYGSRETQVLNIGAEKSESVKISPRPRPESTKGTTSRIRTGCGNLYVTINHDDAGMCELFAQMGKTGGCASSQIEAAGRLISLALRSGVTVGAIIKQLVGIRCPSPSWENGKMVLSCPDAIAQALKAQSKLEVSEQTPTMGMCPECSCVMVPSEGCMTCPSCGFSRCG